MLLINLKDCTGLRELPKSIYRLDSVKTLILSGCTKIDILEEDIVQMKSLTTLLVDATDISKTKMYDVLLSFTGKDNRAEFISHLDSCLPNAGINVFKDNDEIHRGDQISVSLLQAI
ncbi:NBS-containing resistance-like protein, partial [Trifolium medium]|nr:NBS-containing resistance-like protein [Trifolium medium]